MDERLRLDYPGFLLIVLSYMGGNPLGPLGDKDNNYIPTMEHNLEATKHFFENAVKLKDVMYGKVDVVDEEVSNEWFEEHKTL